MRRDELEHAIRAACDIISRDEIIVVGSQSILGSFHEDELPPRATMSTEIDLLPIDDDPQKVFDLSQQIAGAAGEMSYFDDTHGFYLDGVDTTTVRLPDGWRDRLVPVSNDNTRRSGASQRSVGYCLNAEDLCVAKLLAHRTKDLDFVTELIIHGIVDRDIIIERLRQTAQRWPEESRLSIGMISSIWGEAAVWTVRQRTATRC